MRGHLREALKVGLCVVAAVAIIGTAVAGPDDGKPAEAPEFVKLGVNTRPNVKARVYFGRKLLGTTPLKFRRKHDSGPLDLVVRAPGYVTVNTRLYTYKDKVITVRLTRLEEQSKIYGYKAKLPPDGGIDPEDVPDAGVGPSSAPIQPPAPPIAPALP